MPTRRSLAAATLLIELAASAGCAHAQAGQAMGDSTPEVAALAAVARRIDAINAHDTDAFLAAHAEDVAVYGYPDALFGEGRARLADVFRPLFEQGLGSAQVRGQFARGHFVASNETVVEDGAPQHIIYIYRIEDGAIESMRLIANAKEDAAGGALHVSATEQSALAAVARSIDGFNAHDVDAYVGAHAADVGIYVYPDRLLALESAHLRRIFGPQLARGEGAVEVQGQWVQGNVVVTDELLTSNGVTEHVTVVHTVDDGAITSIRLIEEESQ
jgi:hypothetical protein